MSHNSGKKIVIKLANSKFDQNRLFATNVVELDIDRLFILSQNLVATC